jgi:hypothetical protein
MTAEHATFQPRMDDPNLPPQVEKIYPSEEIVGEAIDFLARVLHDPDSVPMEEATRRVAAAVAILNAYAALKTWQAPRFWNE